jgi:hypothetical protein
MGISIDRSLKLQKQAVSRLQEIYSTARIVGLSSAEVQEMRSERVSRVLTQAKAPEWVHTYVQGYEACIVDGLYRNELEFCYVGPDGTMYSTHKETTHRSTEEWYAAGKGHELGNLPAGHFWKGTARAWFMSPSQPRKTPEA